MNVFFLVVVIPMQEHFSTHFYRKFNYCPENYLNVFFWTLCIGATCRDYCLKSSVNVARLGIAFTRKWCFLLWTIRVHFLYIKIKLQVIYILSVLSEQFISIIHILKKTFRMPLLGDLVPLRVNLMIFKPFFKLQYTSNNTCSGTPCIIICI